MKTKSKFISILLTLAMVLAMVPTAALAYDNEVKCYVGGGNIYFDTVSGTVTKADPSLSSITIPETIEGEDVKAIANYAFRGSKNLTDIYIPAGVESIGIEAFANCTNLTDVELPDTLKTIESSAFIGCTGLSGIDMPNGLRTIGQSAFQGCKELTDLTIPNSVKSIGMSAFRECSGLRNITLSNKLTEIESSCFWDCTRLSEIDIPKSVNNIKSTAFSSCKSLTDINIPDSVTTIGERAFEYCSRLEYLDIPRSVKSIRASVFNSCDSLSEIDFGGTEAEWYAAVSGTFPSAFSAVTVNFKGLPVQNYTVTFDANGGNVGKTSSTTSDGKLSSLPNPGRSGYTFEGWYTSAIGGQKVSLSTVYNEDTTLYAHWRADNVTDNENVDNKTYNIKTSYNAANGSIAVTPNKAAKGDKITLTVTIASGCKMTKLTAENSNGGSIALNNQGSGKYTFTMPDSEVVLKAVFEKEEIGNNQQNNNITNSMSFYDVSANTWFYEPVKYVYENGLMNGSTSYAFDPNGGMNRAMLVTVLWRLDGKQQAGSSGFYDVPSYAYYADAVAWAATNHIVNGYTSSQFAPNMNITREQMASILSRYAKYKGYDVSAKTDLSNFKDYKHISSYAMDSMQWAKSTGLLNGKDGNLLVPQGDSSRAEVATMIYRFVQNIK